MWRLKPPAGAAQKDSWAIDYQATLNALEGARAAGAAHFVLLSAICVQRPTLEFQRAKLRFEAALQAAGDITYSIVRPTAFFKSLAGQVRPARPMSLKCALIFPAVCSKGFRLLRHSHRLHEHLSVVAHRVL